MKWLFVLYTAVVVTLLCGCAKEPAPVHHAGLSLTQGDDGIPAVNAEIVAIRSSPDQSHIALVLKQSWTDESGKSEADSWVAIFDPAKKKVVAQTPQPDGSWVGGLFWSPDGKWLAITGSGVSLLGTDGSTRQVVRDIHITDLVWREDVSGRFLYTSAEDETTIHEYDLDTDEDRQIPANHLVLSLFNVNGKPYASYMRGKTWMSAERHVIYVAEVDTWKERLRVPLYETSQWDYFMLEVSPDGRFFFLRSRASGGARNVIARVEDAREVFRKPHMAIMWQDAPEDGYEVLWPQTVPHSEDSIEKSQVLIRSLFGSFWVDLGTGNQQHWSSTPKALYVDWWRPAQTDSSGSYKESEYLALTEDGLSVHEGSWNWLRPGSTMIKHTPQEE